MNTYNTVGMKIKRVREGKIDEILRASEKERERAVAQMKRDVNINIISILITRLEQSDMMEIAQLHTEILDWKDKIENPKFGVHVPNRCQAFIRLKNILLGCGREDQIPILEKIEERIKNVESFALMKAERELFANKN